MREPTEHTSQPTCTSGPCPAAPSHRAVAVALIGLLFHAAFYAVFVFLLAAGIGLCRLFGWTCKLSIVGWSSDPYDNIFIRAAVWCGICIIMSLVIPLVADLFAARLPSGPRRVLATALVAWAVIVAGQLLWMAFVHLVGAQTDLTFSWQFNDLLNNPLVRAAPMALLFTFLQTVRIDAAKAKTADSPEI
jgi:hypothetical protein